MPKYPWLVAGIILVVLLGAIPIANWALVDLPVQAALSDNERNNSVSIHAYHKSGLLPGAIVIDIWDVDDGASMADITRALFVAAEALKDRRYDRVYLAFRSKHRFFLEGTYFQRLGLEYAFQNPVYLMRTLPENVYRLDGRQAYGIWTGGVLGVLSEQMQDLNEFHREWYLDDLFGASLDVYGASTTSV